MLSRFECVFAASVLICIPAFGWGADGHRMIDVAAIRALPNEVPAFVRNAADEIGYLAPEPDRQKGAGETRDKAYSPGHYLDVSDDGTVLGGPRLDALPQTLEAYDAALRAVGKSQYQAGYVPYSIVNGYQLVVKDFALFRAYACGAATAKSAAARKAYARLRGYREKIVLHDIGLWSHFIGDGSQPLHITVHFNGWGKYPNPEGFTSAPVHGPWESAFVHAHVSEPMIARAMAPLSVGNRPILPRTEAYLRGTHDAVVPFYRLEKKKAFDADTPTAEGIAFTVKQLARGADELRDLIVRAWRESAHARVGWPEVPVSDIEAGKAPPPPAFGG